mmetsp:Transcript_133687/g.250137  ORF Transcript_133687/g.250137 Transcript_133687/m.250137 type:complete len:591 (-) Transcript_133687:157-1929(-)
MFDFDEIEEDVAAKGGDAWAEEGKGGGDAIIEENSAGVVEAPEVYTPGPGAVIVEEEDTTKYTPATAHRRPGGPVIDIGKKVIISGIKSEAELNNKVGEIMPPGFDGNTKRYMVKIMNFGAGTRVAGRAENQAENMRSIKGDNLELHPDQVEKDRLEAEEGAIVLLGSSESERKAREMLFSIRLDPQYSYDKVIETVFSAKNEFEVLGLEPKLMKDSLKDVKRAYRRLSVAVHPDKNSHPQAVDAFRKVYGAFETLMDVKQQWRLLFVMGKLKEDETELYEMEAEEEERFEWWLQANVSEMEKQAAEADGGVFEEIGDKWIGGGEKLNEVKWIGVIEAMRLHSEGKCIFLDSRETFEFGLEHINGAYTVPLKDFVDYGLAGVAGEWVGQVIKNKEALIIIYSEVATPFSRCRSLCRWMLAAGSKSLKPERFRRLRGGLFGWRHKKGPMQLALTDVSPEKREQMRKDAVRQVGGLKPGDEEVNLRIRVASAVDKVPGVISNVPGETSLPILMLHDASGGVACRATTEAQKKALREAAKKQGSLLLFNIHVILNKDERIIAVLGEKARVEKAPVEYAFGFMAKNISEDKYDP